MTDYTGKVAFITGGASGAGFGQAIVFAEVGCRIVIADIRRAAIDEAAAKLRARGAEVHGIELDVTDRAAYARAADEVEQVFGKPPVSMPSVRWRSRRTMISIGSWGSISAVS